MFRHFVARGFFKMTQKKRKEIFISQKLEQYANKLGGFDNIPKHWIDKTIEEANKKFETLDEIIANKQKETKKEISFYTYEEQLSQEEENDIEAAFEIEEIKRPVVPTDYRSKKCINSMACGEEIEFR